MIDLEDRITDLLTRTGDAVEVRPDLDRVVRAPIVVPLTGTPRTTRRRRRAVLVAAAALAFVAAGALTFRAAVPSGTPSDVAGPAGTSTGEGTLRVPRYLVTAPDWKVTFVDPGGTEMNFEDSSGRGLLLSWYREQASYPPAAHTTTVDGHDAVVFTDRTVFFGQWADSGLTFRIDGHNFESEDDFRAVLATVEAVDQQTWHAALPEGTELPGGRP